ncbi:6-bladed beta-propeller [Gemmatimonadota bacterium]
MILGRYVYQKISAKQSDQSSSEDLIPINLTPLDPLYSDPVFDFVEVATIRNEPAEPLLMYPTEIALDRAGNIYIAEGGDTQQVVVFSPEGHHLRSFGRFGSGPGEFQNLSITSIEGDLLYLFDPNLNRITRYTIRGEFVDVTAVRTGALDVAVLDSERKQIVAIQRLRGRGRREEDSYSVQARVAILDSTQTELRVVESEMVQYMGYNKKDRTVQALYYAPFPSAVYSKEHGIVMTTGAQPVVNQYDCNGSLTRQLLLNLNVEAVSQSDRQRMKEYRRAQLANEQMPVPGGYEDRELLFTEQKAYWRHVRIDDDGFIWLTCLWDFETLDQGLGTKCYVIHPNGTWLGTCYLPNSNGRFSKGYYLALMVDQETGERIPTVYQITSAVEGLSYPIR